MYLKLYKSYLKEMDILKKYIASLRKNKDLKNPETFKFRINTLYSMYLDMKHTAQYLKIKCEVMKNEK